jgi:uncharacterized membrane protein
VVETLEERIVLDGTPAAPLPAIVVSRTLAAYTVADVRNNQETITYTVYNEQAEPVSGVLLTDTLQPGVTFVGASQLPDRSGPNLAWSLGTIAGFDRASITLTVSLASPTPLQLDGGAQAFATLDAGAVSNATPAATLRPGSVDPSLLASTPDANTTDPFVQEQAAKLNYDPQQIFNYLHNDIGYNSYTGSLRGARGTLWSSAGNALDIASLGVALMRASGIPAQYVSGTLAKSDAQALILSMFPPSFQTVGFIPAETQTADPANDPQLLSETTNHFWFQFDTGSGLKDADPLMTGATVGKTFTTATGTFTEVPDALREKETVTLNAELTSQAGSLFGLASGGSTPVLTQAFNDVDLVGHPLTVGNLVSTSTTSAVTAAVATTTYSPYLAISDLAYDSTHDQIVRGQDFQEATTSLAFGSTVLTGLFLDITLSGPGGPAQTYERALVDRIGYANRQSGQAKTLASSAGPALTSYDVFTLNVLAGLNDPVPMAELNQEIQREAAQTAQLPSSSQAALALDPVERNLDIGLTRLTGNEVLGMSDVHTQLIASSASVVAYFDRPRIVMTADRLIPDTSGTTYHFAGVVDLIRDSVRIVAAPGQNPGAKFVFNAVRGIYENAVEHNVLAALAPAGQAMSKANTLDVMAAAAAQGISLRLITSANLDALASLPISDDARARITTAIEQGNAVIVPEQMVLLNGALTTAWAQINLATGEYIGVTDDGGNEALFDWFALYTEAYIADLTLLNGLAGPLDGFFAGAIISLKYEFCNMLSGDKAACDKQVEDDKKEVKELFEDNETKLLTLSAAVLGYIYAAEGDDAAIKLVDITVHVIEEQDVKEFETSMNAFTKAIIGLDPPISIFDVGLQSTLGQPTDHAHGSLVVPGLATAGSVQGSGGVPGLAAAGTLDASWTSTADASFGATAVSAAGATVTDAHGQPIGAGSIAVAASAHMTAVVSGNVGYAVHGQGSLSFYGEVGNSLVVSADWVSYAATLSGSPTLQVAADSLTLNGQALPTGTYRITAPSIQLSGSGHTSSANFAGSASVTATGGTINVGRSSGSLTVAGKSIPVSSGATLTGYTGSITIAAGGSNNLDHVTFNGSAANVLTVSTTPSTLTTDQNTPVTFQANVNTSFADTYNLTAQAPPGWTVTFDNSGKIMATPAPGLQGGTFPIQIVAQSTANPDLVAQTTLNVTIRPTVQGINFTVTPDSLFTVPFNGAQLPTAFRASIQNLGPSADSYKLTFANVPIGFTLLNSGTSVTVPAGQTGILGLYLQPNAGQPTPAPGTPLSFTVTATSTSNPAITRTLVVAFTMPAIDAVLVSTSEPQVASTPGTATTATLTLQNAGNVPENVSLTATTPAGVTLSGLQPFTLAVGQTATETITLTPAAIAALNIDLATTLTATFGPSANPQTATAELDLLVRSAQTVALTQAAIAAGQTSDSQLATTLTELGDTVSLLQATPTDAMLLNRVQFLLGNLSTLLSADPALASFVTALQPIQAKAAAGDVAGLLALLPSFFSSLTNVLAVEATQQFSVSAAPTPVDLFVGQGKDIAVQLVNQGTSAIPLTLSTAGLPAGVTVHLSQNQLTLAPGATATVTVTLTQTQDLNTVFTLQVIAAASLVQHAATVDVEARPAAADVLSVSVNPVSVQAGSPVAVSAQVFNTANAARTLQAKIDVFDAAGNPVLTVLAGAISLVPGSGAQAVDLRSLATTGLATGVYSLRVSLLTGDGSLLPGHAAQTVFGVGQPVSATVAASPLFVPPGNSSVATSITVTSQAGTSSSGPPPKFLVASEGTDSVLSYDSQTGAFLGAFIPQGSAGLVAPNTLAYGPDGNLYVDNFRGGPSQVLRFDGVTGTNGSTFIPPGSGPILATTEVFLPDGSLLVGSYGTSSIMRFDGTTGAFLGTFIAAGSGGLQQTSGFTLGPDGNLYVGSFTDNDILRYDGRTGAFLGIFVAPGSGDLSGPQQVLFGPDGNFYVASLNNNYVNRYDGRTGAFIDHFASGNGLDGPTGIAFGPNGDLFVNNYNTSSITHFQGTTGAFLGVFVAAGAGGLSHPTGIIFTPAPRPAVSLKVTQGLPAAGYTVDPTSITPAPASSSAAQVVWSPAAVNTSNAFQLGGTVTNMAPGEVRAISTGTTVAVTTTTSTGQPLTSTLNLPPLLVAAKHIISLSPPAQSTPRNTTVSFTLTLTNPLPTAETYTLSTSGLDLATDLPATVALAAGQTTTLTLHISVPPGAAIGSRFFQVLARTQERNLDATEGQLTVTADVVLPARAVSASLTPSQATAGQGTSAVFTVQVTNTGNVADSYTLQGSFPSGITASFAQTTIAVPPGEGNFRDVRLVLTPAAGTAPGNYPFRVTVVSQADGSVMSIVQGTLTILSQGVSVKLTPSSTAPGSPLQLTVTNTGQMPGTFDLSLASPGALVTKLGAASVTLAPGTSQIVPVTTGAVNFAVPGPLPLTGIATLHTNTAVEASATAQLIVPATVGLTAEVNPPTQRQPLSGPASFTVLVHNTGNTEDAYTATITGTSAGITAASLIGLDGQPTQTIPLFRLPGLATGALLLQAQGQGTITVQVKSLTHAGIFATVTATVLSPIGLLVLAPTGDALKVSGGGSLNVGGGAIIVDSSDSQDAADVSGNARVTAAEIDVTGGIRTSGKAGFSTPVHQAAPTPDPINLPLPPAPAATFAKVHVDKSATLSPGTYPDGIDISGKSVVTLAPGVYYLDKDFAISGQASVTGTGVLLVFAQGKDDAELEISGQAQLTLSAPTNLTGAYAPYNGMSIYVDRAAEAEIEISGQAVLTASGIIYAPSAELEISGGGQFVVSRAEVIVATVDISGTGSATMNLDPPRAATVAIVSAPAVTTTVLAAASTLAPTPAAAFDAHFSMTADHSADPGQLALIPAVNAQAADASLIALWEAALQLAGPLDQKQPR